MKRASSSGSGRSSAQRLPVNHRRHKVAPEHRKRVATACNIRRIKCSGDQPCLQCANSSRECEYPQAVEKVTIPRSELEELRRKCASLEQSFKEATRDGAYRREFIPPPISGTAASSTGNSATHSTDNTDDDASAGDGRLLLDRDGIARYLGSTSGATFLDSLKEFMRAVFPLAWPNAQPGSQSPEVNFLGSLGYVQTFDGRPLDVMDHDGVVPTILPDLADMNTMVAQLKYFIQDGDGEYASGGIFYWGDLNPSDLGLDASRTARGIRRLALFNAAFAMNCHLGTPPEALNKSVQLGEPYFLRARYWLGNPLVTTNYTPDDIPALAMTSLYLVEVNRRDTAYLYVTIGMHLAIMRGIHRGMGVDEHGKRAFWTLYVLDRWLCCLMGRPPTIQDDAIKLQPPTETSGLPRAIGLKAHVELSKICGYIVCNTYRIAPWEPVTTSTSTLIDNTLNQLTTWKSRLPPELQIDDLSNTRDRACYELHMSYCQLLILTIRPIFFGAVKKAVADRFTDRSFELEKHPRIAHIRQCVDAARQNMQLGRLIRRMHVSQKLLTSTLHNIFNAATILLLNLLLSDRFDESHDKDEENVWFAIECFQAEARPENNYAIDCASVLKDLNSFVTRLRTQPGPDNHQVPSNSHSLQLRTNSGNASQLVPTSMTAATAPPPPPLAPALPATTAYDVGFILNHAPTLLPNTFSVPEMIYAEISQWADNDEYSLYDDTAYMV